MSGDQTLRNQKNRTHFLDNLRTFMIFLVVLYHCGLVYENSGVAAFFWIVHDPATNALASIPNLMVIDIFIMAVIFFVSGILTPPSLRNKSAGQFIFSKLRRLMIPWAIAALILIPLYKVMFLYSRDLPQESWTAYFHFSNGDISQSWLWFLPVLFLFNLVYVILSRLDLDFSGLSLRMAVASFLIIGFFYSFFMDIWGFEGWTKTVLLDFQNERLLIYFMLFLLGSLCYKLNSFGIQSRNKGLYVAVLSTAWVPVIAYRYLFTQSFVNPGNYLFSQITDAALLWFCFHLSLLSLIYLMVKSFGYYLDRQGRLGGALRDYSYGVYIIHTVVMGGIALAMLDWPIPSLMKYAILLVSTFALSNLIIYFYQNIIKARLLTKLKITKAKPAAA